MSRSRKKSPYMGNTGDKSEKKFKRHNNRKVRKKLKNIIKNYDPDNDILPDEKDMVQIWDGPKDGKSRFDEYDEENEKYFRK